MPGDKLSGFEAFLTSQSAQIPILAFSVNLVITALITYLLSRIYIRYGRSISNRSLFAQNLIFIAMATMVVISIVKSSLALSLGLVGALSIVRFRAAIKEPEELIYLFIAISIGLGMGADQTPIVLMAFIIISTVIAIRHHFSSQQFAKQNLFVTISLQGDGGVSLKQLSDILCQHCDQVDIRRYDQNQGGLEATFNATFDTIEQLNELTESLRAVNKNIGVRFVDQSGII